MDSNLENQVNQTNDQIVNAELVAEQDKAEQEKALNWLSESELYAYQYFQNKYKNDPKKASINQPLSPEIREQLFSLFLNGKTLAEIWRLNQKFSLGQIVDSAVTGDWNKLRQEYLVTIQERAQSRMRQVACESVDFIADHIAATHKFQGDKIRKYLQTGNKDDLDGINLGSLQQYKALIEMLVKITGNDQPKPQTIKETVVLTAKPIAPATENKELPPVSQSLAELAALKKTQGK